MECLVLGNECIWLRIVHIMKIKITNKFFIVQFIIIFVQQITLMLKFVKMMINKEYGTTILTVTKNKSQDRVIEFLVNNCHDKDTLTWYYHDGSVQDACKGLKISKSYFDRMLRQLVGLCILHKKARGVYILSKEYFQTISEQ